MTALIPHNTNPFLKDYSSTTLLKRNYQLLKQSKLLIKQNQNSQTTLISHPNSNYPVPYAFTDNPFQKKSLDALHLIKEKRNPNDSHLSQIRSLSKSKNLLSSVQKNRMYRGLQEIGTKELRKSELEKQARYLLKQYGSQTLRYQYHPQEKYAVQIPNNNFKPIHKNIKLTEKFRKSINSYEKYKQTLSFNQNTVTSQYYGHDQGKYSSYDNFYIKKRENNSQNKRQSHFLTDKQGKNKQKHRLSCYDEIIVEDRNQDLQTNHNINKLQLPQKPNARRSKVSAIYDPKLTSIENISTNFHHDQSMLSNFGASSEMYESGQNFRMRFGHKKQGPLNTKEFDEDNKSEQWQNDHQISRQHIRQYPDRLQYENNIYHMIPL